MALQGEQPIDERPGAGRCRRAGGGRHDGRSAGRRAQPREGLLQGLDLFGQIGLLVGRRGIDPIQLGQELELDPAELEPVRRGGQLALERGPRRGRRRAQAPLEPGDLALLAVDGGFELRAPLGARRPGRRPGPLGLIVLREHRRAGAGGVEGSLERALRGLLLAAIEVPIEDASDRLHGGPRVLVPGDRALERRHHRLRRHPVVAGRRSGVLRVRTQHRAKKRDAGQKGDKGPSRLHHRLVVQGNCHAGDRHGGPVATRQLVAVGCRT